MARAKGTVAVRFTGDVADLKRATDDAERGLKGFGDNANKLLKGALAGAGVAAGAALVGGMFEAVDRESSTARLAAQLGLSDAEAKQLGETAGDVYAEGFGDSFRQVGSALVEVRRTLGDFTDGSEQAFEDLTIKALSFADLFETDVSTAILTAGTLLRRGLVKDADEAFDILVRGAQEMPQAIRDELFEASNEYGTFFSDLGLNADQMFGLLTKFAEEGRIGIDKAGDAVKELTIRTVDGSEATAEAFEEAGLSADRMGRRFAAGGDEARGALIDLVNGLLGIKDPVERSQAAVALFGTPLEDLSQSEIPAFLEALGNMQTGLGGVEGAADDAFDGVNDTAEAKLRKFKRTVSEHLTEYLANEVIPFLENDFGPWGSRMWDQFNSGLDRFLAAWDPFWQRFDSGMDKVQNWFQDRVDAFGRGIDQITEDWREFLEFFGLSQPSLDPRFNPTQNPHNVNRVHESEPERLPPGTEEFFNPQPEEETTGTGGSRVTRRAHGGRVGANTPYWVGEEGVPELFVPDTAGRVVAPRRRGSSGPSGVININEGGSLISVNGGDHDANSLAGVVAWRLAGLS